MKILVFNGSPKKERSDTMHITRAFLDGINSVSENDVHIINVMDKHIEFCTGCLGCMYNGGKCVHNDDMKDIIEEMLSSDVIVWSFPLYYYGMPAPLKALIDRTLPMSSIDMEKVGDHYEHKAQMDSAKLRFVMICGCGFPNSNNNFDAMVMHFKMMFRGDSTILTVPESPMFNIKEAEGATKPFLEVVHKAGQEYAQNGEISAPTMERLQIPMIPHEIYAQIVNSTKQ